MCPPYIESFHRVHFLLDEIKFYPRLQFPLPDSLSFTFFHSFARSLKPVFLNESLSFSCFREVPCHLLKVSFSITPLLLRHPWCLLPGPGPGPAPKLLLSHAVVCFVELLGFASYSVYLNSLFPHLSGNSGRKAHLLSIHACIVNHNASKKLRWLSDCPVNSSGWPKANISLISKD